MIQKLQPIFKRQTSLLLVLVLLLSVVQVLFLPKKTEAAIAMRGTNSVSNTTGTSANLAPSALTKDSDIMIAVLFNGDNPNSVTPPTGSTWTQIGSTCVSGTGQGITNFRVYWRKYLTSDTNWTWSGWTSGPYHLSITSYSGVNHTNPIHAVPATFCASGTGTFLAANNLTTTVANTYMVGVFGIGNSNSGTTHTITPSGATERYGFSGGYNYSCGLFCTNTKQYEYSYSDSTQAVAGTTSRSAFSNVSSPWAATNFALAPAADAVLTQSAYRWFANADSASPFVPITSNPTAGADNALVSAQNIADGHIFVAGYDSTGSNQWRIEKRNIKTGNLCTAAECGTQFGTNGVVTNNSTAGDDRIHNLGLDVAGGYLYAVGFDSTGSNQWRIEKRNLGDGALVSGFGSGGVVTNNPTAGNDKAKAFALDVPRGVMYVGGFESTNGIQWRVEKRSLADGALVSGFGGSGCATNVAGALCYDGSAGIDEVLSMKIDGSGTYVYLGGYDGNNGNQWHLQKRNAANGNLCTAAECGTAFDTDGIITVNPSANNDVMWDLDLSNSGNFMILTGYDSQYGSGNTSMRLEKRSLSDGALDGTFGNTGCLSNTTGVLCNNPTSGNDEIFSTELDTSGGYLFTVGSDSSNGTEWYIEKRSLSTGTRDNSFDTDGIITSNPTAGFDQAADVLFDSTRGTLWVIGNDSGGGTQWRLERYNTNDGSSALAAQDTAMSNVRLGDTFRMQLLLHVATAELLIDVVQFKLQFAVKSGGTCGTYSDIGTASGDIRFYNNTTPVDGALTSGASGQPVHGVDGNMSQTYEEANNFTNAYIVPVGTDALWDFSLVNFSAPANTTYCFRTVKSDNSTITYGVTPELTTSPISTELSAYRWYDNVDSADFLSVTSNPTATNDHVRAMAQDTAGGYIYLAGHDATGSDQWRIEKRDTGGSLVTGFGTSGTVTDNITAGSDQITDIALDVSGGFMYVIGYDSTGGGRWQIQKRNLSDGALVSGFGTSGRATSDPTVNEDRPMGIAIDTGAGFMYLAGYQGVSSSNKAIRIEKRNLSDGALVSGFGTSGSITQDIGSSDDAMNDIAIDASAGYMYVAGYDLNIGGATNSQWEIQKRLLTTGALENAFDTDGRAQSNPTNNNDRATVLAIDPSGGYMYVGGFDRVPSNFQWRLEKRKLTSGALCTAAECGTEFATAGALQNNFTPSSGGDDEITDLALDVSGGYIYVVGSDYTTSNTDGRWRIEKRQTSSASLVTAFDTDGVVTSDPTTGRTDESTRVLVDTGAQKIYIGGFDAAPAAGNEQWRMEIRNATDGSPALTPAALAAQDTKALPSVLIFRLRALIHIAGDGLAANGQSFKLQVSPKSGTCDTAFIGETYVDLDQASGEVRFYDNSNMTDGSAVVSISSDPNHAQDSKVNQTYEESNTFTNPNTIPVLRDGLWDFALRDDSAFGNYCFRAVKSGDIALDSYTQIPEIALCTRPRTGDLLRGGNYFCDGSKKKFYWSL